jgi:hypothetical protein
MAPTSRPYSRGTCRAKFGDHTRILALAIEDQDLAIEHD